jgi:hypothetical protein
VRGGSDLGDGRVYLLGGGEAEAEVGGRRAGLVVQDGGEGLEAAADARNGFPIACQAVRLLPCLLVPWSAPGAGTAVCPAEEEDGSRGSGCIAA